MKDRLRYLWNGLLAQSNFLTFVGSLVFGFAIGVLAYDLRSDWLSSSLLVSLESQCQNYMGPRAMLIYRERRFYCLPERP